MIDEQVLERALRAEAQSYPPPAGGPGALRAAVAAEAPERRPRRLVFGLAAAAAVVVAVAAVPTVSRTAPGSGRALSTQYDGSAGGGGGSNGGSTDGSTDGYTYGDKLLGEKADAPNDANVVRTGEVTVEVGDAPKAIAELTRIATSRRGFVAASSSGGSPDERTGSVTLRVPVAEFDAAVAEAGRVGRVLSSLTSGTDVTAEVTDVAARLKSLTAARAQLQALLAKAKDVSEVLAVQQRITETQTEIERLQAQQASLADRTTFATLRVDVAEEGAYDGEPDGFSKAWRDATDGFVSAAQGLVAASGTIAFVLLVLALLTLALRPAYRAWVRRVV